jgi:spoIIIJ-associated protein
MDRRQEVEDLARTFLEAMSLSLTTAVSEQEDRVQVDLSGPDSYLLLERKGSVLDALQLLIGKVAETRFGLDRRLVVDCDGYRRTREDDLARMALGVAEKVRRLRQPIEMDPLNPYERRIVHLALADQPGVSACSEGDGFLKRITVSPT